MARLGYFEIIHDKKETVRQPVKSYFKKKYYFAI